MRMTWGVPEQGWRKGPWTPEEDQLLTEYVNLYGEGRWSSVARCAGLNRSGKSCRLRWVNYLRPGLKRGQITPQEEGIIIELHALWGNKWSTIARYLPGRTDNEIKNYWRTHFKSKEKSSQKQEKKKVQILKLKQQQLSQLQAQPIEDQKGVLSYAEAAAAIPGYGSKGIDQAPQEIRQEMVFMYPTLEDQCLPVMMMPQDSASWSDHQPVLDDGIPWGGLWNLDDDYHTSMPRHTHNNTGFGVSARSGFLTATIAAPKLDPFISASQRSSLGKYKRCGDV
ncbi:hypothetical protein SLEP1_g10566 [Rubroshorea leprosula]|uniref:Uncharacterized protein n=1 Tax=Rubroshorea leprosula TaxID=152421 RepID=A0AAV5I8G6_9ROSI|nr:hypothetical protein SLEP1_g10566 [Rubroshorea leprosula]